MLLPHDQALIPAKNDFFTILNSKITLQDLNAHIGIRTMRNKKKKAKELCVNFERVNLFEYGFDLINIKKIKENRYFNLLITKKSLRKNYKGNYELDCYVRDRKHPEYFLSLKKNKMLSIKKEHTK